MSHILDQYTTSNSIPEYIKLINSCTPVQKWWHFFQGMEFNELVSISQN